VSFLPTLLAATEAAGLQDILFAGGWVGISILLTLLALSMTAVYLVFDHALTIRRDVIVPRGLADVVHKSLSTGQRAQAERQCQEKPSLLASVLLSGIGERKYGWPAIEKAVEDSVAQQAARLFRRIEYLSVIGNIAPMVGLLGTVTGMIFAFRAVASTQGAAGAADLAEGIYQALITTVAGLLVAIPALGAFAIFRNRVESLVADVTDEASHALGPLRRYQDAARATPPPRRTSKEGT
jgi:biopolymer transport protein ExbB